MSLPDVWDLFDHWKEFPPVHILFRSYVGYKGPGETGEVNQTEDLLLNTSGPLRGFSSLPPEVQESIRKESNNVQSRNRKTPRIPSSARKTN